ncbi:MAG: N-formylglutamate amidohydrolase [Alphaproteobacteria bacterium]
MSVISIRKPSVKALPLVFDSPHSGRVYPPEFDYACDFNLLERAEDRFVEELFAAVPEYGAVFLAAEFPRSFVDVNRAIDDIDPQILDGAWGGDFAINPTARSDAGIGLIRRLIKPGIPLYKSKLSSAEVMRRIEEYYRPYHTALADLIEDAHYRFGQVFHINCHSMPAATAVPKRPIGLWGSRSKAVDFVLGDRDGTTCDPAFTRAVKKFVESMGYSCTINDPFKGVALVAEYSNPLRGYHSLQIEVNKALYMDEETCEQNAGFARVQADIERLIGFIAEYVAGRLVSVAAD